MYEGLLFVHILAAMIWVGGGILLTLVTARAQRERDIAFRLRFTRVTAMVGPISGISAMVVLLAGVGMVLINDAWTVSQTWIWLALVLFTTSILVGAGYFSRADKRILAAHEAGNLEEADRLTRQMLIVSRADIALLLVIVELMVFKPGAPG